MVTKKDLLLYGKEKRILFVDDDPIIREIIKKSFDGYFKEVVIAIDGKDALEKYKNSFFDIVITDISMPNMNGIELVKNIKNIHPEELIIVLSSVDDGSYFIELLNIGVDGFVVKPFNFKKVAQKIIDSLESLYYKKLLYDVRKEKIILEYKASQKDSALAEELRKKTTSILEHTGRKVVGKKSAKEFFDDITEVYNFEYKISDIINQIGKLKTSIHGLIIFASNSGDNLDYDIIKNSLDEISQQFLIVFHSLNEFERLSEISDPFYAFYIFFDDYKNIDFFDLNEVKELLSIEFISDDIEAFLNMVFISKEAENLYIYKDLFEQNLSQLESNIKNVNSDVDDGELDFF
jgi:YesN/AraC family two-component response regulator